MCYKVIFLAVWLTIGYLVNGKHSTKQVQLAPLDCVGS